MHSFTSILIHCVWSTKKREPFLSSDVNDRLWPYLGGIARENKMKALAIGGVADHVHMLISLPGTLSFEWQEGYGAFSIGISRTDATVQYIYDQAEHHRTRSFSRRIYGHVATPRPGLRRANARLILSSLPGLISLLYPTQR